MEYISIYNIFNKKTIVSVLLRLLITLHNQLSGLFIFKLTRSNDTSLRKRDTKAQKLARVCFLFFQKSSKRPHSLSGHPYFIVVANSDCIKR